MTTSPALDRHLFGFLSSIALLGFLFAIVGCAQKGGGQSAGTTGDYVNGTPLPERREGTSFFGGNVQRGEFSPIYFDFDSQSIRASENGKIEEIANSMKGSSSEIIIAGFTDERGTAEYNLALGERRAVSARAYLVSLGIAADRLRTVSYGKEFPFDAGHDEAAFAKNRRAHFVITAK